MFPHVNVSELSTAEINDKTGLYYYSYTTFSCFVTEDLVLVTNITFLVHEVPAIAVVADFGDYKRCITAFVLVRTTLLSAVRASPFVNGCAQKSCSKAASLNGRTARLPVRRIPAKRKRLIRVQNGQAD